ncbi:MAG TPA: MBL fold metallo-hydrolase [Thiobacillaceae bacterium]|nr:MBL fold metallo-hydrolase [Thiobacillaceae bacterium]HNU63762.1 MBL fold metallo-hydrolase [Thiobacillaceae bacterium]
MLAPIHHEHGITTLDADYLRPGLAAVHLLVERGRVALLDTGTRHCIPALLAELRALGLTPEDVEYIIVTHVHLDHAGGAGALMQICPRARLVAHPSGARHLVDPARLVAGTQAVYGEEAFQRLYGDIVPVAAERVLEAPDQYRLDFHGRVLTFMDTPGHARHHFCMHDARSESVFCGDTFGISYREFDVGGRAFIFPSTTPVQFDPLALHASIERILALEPEAAFLTHYGRVTNLEALAPRMHEFIDEWCELTLAAEGEGQARQSALEAALEKSLIARLHVHGCILDEAACRDLLAHDLHLNAQGLLVWRDRK